MPFIRTLFACFLAAMTFASIEAGVFFNTSRKNEDHAVAKLDGTAARLVTFLDHADITQREQSLYLQAEQNHLRKVTLPKLDAAIQHFGEAAGGMQTLISNTDASLNRRPDGVLPTLQSAEISADQGIQMFTEQSQPMLDESAKAAHKLEQAATAVSDLAEDESWQHVAENVEAMTTSLVGASGNVNATTQDVREAVHRFVHPSWPARVFGYAKSAGEMAFHLLLP